MHTEPKPTSVDQPARTARTTVHCYNGTPYCSTKTVPIIFDDLGCISVQGTGTTDNRTEASAAHC